MTIDHTQPNFGRIYDYVLGGNHNFEADREAARKIMQVFPPYPRWARLNRWFLQIAAERWQEEGLNDILDLGSGLPTQGHFHSSRPDARVLYSELDPVIVAYSKEILGDAPNVIYHHGDVRKVEEILSLADRFFGGNRRVGLGFIGLSYVIEDEHVAHVAQALADWAAPGSSLAMTYISIDPGADIAEEMKAIHKLQAKVPAFFRELELVQQLMQPWRLEESKGLEQWHEVEDQVEASDRVGAGFKMSGAFFRR
jgi:hypothetical protein